MVNQVCNTFVVGMLLLIPITFYGQQKGYKISKNNKNRPEAFPSPYSFRPTGWIFDGGITGTFGQQPEENLFLGSESEYKFPISPFVKLTAGRYFILKKGHKIVKYADASFGYKGLWNRQENTLTSPVMAPESYVQSNLAHYITLNGHLNNVISFNNATFLQNTIGVNLDYRIAEYVQEARGSKSPDEFVAQIHYSLGLGIMTDNDLAIIPYIEIPVFNVTPSQARFNRLDYFNSSYQTIVVGVKVALFRFGQKECPTAIDPMGTGGQNNGY